ncbi:MAG TPA: hypothetical protein VEG62_08910, partial [Acidimicrobiales bacterium]|nr:hypothetical protein [Acidimicrobiales bacterium]
MGAVNGRATVRVRVPRGRAAAPLVLVLVLVITLVVALCSVGPAPRAGATTSTTLPGPAPNQPQIDATQSQVSQIESTLAQEEQQTAVLDNLYDTAVQNLQNAQSALQAIETDLLHTRSTVEVDKRLVANDAVAAYVYGTPETGLASYFDTTATLSQARTEYTDEIVGNLTNAEQAL